MHCGVGVAFDSLTVHEDVFAGDLDEDGAVPALPNIAQHTSAGQRERDLAIHVAAQQDFRHEGRVQLASTERWANWNLARSERGPGPVLRTRPIHAASRGERGRRWAGSGSEVLCCAS